jgi:toxin ParE1/3/4
VKRLDVLPEAEADLRGIWIYTFQTWGEAQADKYLDV